MYLETDYGSIGDTAEMYTTVTFDGKLNLSQRDGWIYVYVKCK